MFSSHAPKSQNRGFTFVIALLFALAASACDSTTAPDVPSVAAPSTPAPASNAVRVVFLGDSLTAGLGLPQAQAFPAVLERMLLAESKPIRAVNAGVSGDTTAGGLSRLDWLLSQKPDVIVIALGGNDGLRGIDVRASEDNLRQIILQAKAAGARVLLVGMMMPPNYGPQYTQQFADIYPRLARELDVPLVPFMLEGVGGVEELNQPDGIHPTADGHEKIARTVLPELRRILDSLNR
jgi:acyl-CoA thioesterase-1